MERENTVNRRKVLQGLAGAGAVATGATQGTLGDWFEAKDRYVIGIDPASERKEAASTQARTNARTVHREFSLGEIRHIVSGWYDQKQIEQLRSHPAVDYVQKEIYHEPVPVELTETADTNAREYPWGIEHIGARKAHENDKTGEDTSIVIIDTGTDATHPALEDNVSGGNAVGEADCVEEPRAYETVKCTEPWDDDQYHGTHVSGSAAAVDKDIKDSENPSINVERIAGVAPEADLYGANVFEWFKRNGQWRALAPSANTAKALKWSADEGHDVVNASLGGPQPSQAIKDALTYAVEENDVMFVAAAGNSGKKCPNDDCVGYPAAHDISLAVANINPDNETNPTSSRGPEVDVAAPGTDILSSMPPHLKRDTNVDSYYWWLNGTSMASPHVAGMAALIKAHTDLETPEEIRTRIEETAKDIGERDVETGKGLVDIPSALESGLKAVTGPNRSVEEKTEVTLDASNSRGSSLSYSWEQISGPSVTLSDKDTATPTFTAPDVDEPQKLKFEVTVDNGQKTDSDTVTITVTEKGAAGKFKQVSKITADDRDEGDNFGQKVTVDGDVALMTAPYDEDPNGQFAGSTYVYERSDGEWSKQAKLAPPEQSTGQTGSQHGSADPDSKALGELPTPTAKEPTADSSDIFGYSVDLSGKTAIIGAIGDEDPHGSRAGSAYVYVRTDSGWRRQAKLIAEDGEAEDQFGYRVSVDGDTAIVGAPFEGENATGAAYLFRRDGDNWRQKRKLALKNGVPDSFFGASVSVHNDTALIGAPSDENRDGVKTGAVYVLKRSGGSWGLQAKLTPPDGDKDDSFGFPVEMSGDTALVSAYSDEDPNGKQSGSAYVFVRKQGNWTFQQKLTPEDNDSRDQFGLDIAIQKNTVLIGANGDEDPNGTQSGSVYVYRRNGETWNEQQKLTAKDGSNGDNFGYAVGYDGKTAIIGANDVGPRTDSRDDFNGAGASYVFEASDGSDDPDPDGLAISVRPQEAEVSPGGTHTVELVVEGATNGIGGYDAELSVGDTGIATITDAKAFNAGGLFDVTIADDGSSVALAGLVSFDGKKKITLAEIEITAADQEGETTLDLVINGISDPDGNEYKVGSVSDGSMTVTGDAGPGPLPSGPQPQDLDGDGLYEDLNGDGDFSIADIQIYFNEIYLKRDSEYVKNNVQYYNFNGEDEISIADVQALFNMYKNQ